MKLTRRELAGIAAALPAVAQTPGPPKSVAEQAAADVHENVAEIRKIKLPLDTEPAFSFRAQ
jgi:hypothetical protein